MLEGFTPHTLTAIYSVVQDGYGQETRTSIKTSVKCRFVRGIITNRDYIPEYRASENVIYKATCYIPYSEISDITIDYGYIFVYDSVEYRVIDIYDGVDFDGNIDYKRFRLE